MPKRATTTSATRIARFLFVLSVALVALAGVFLFLNRPDGSPYFVNLTATAPASPASVKCRLNGMSTTIRISDSTRDRIKAVSKMTGKQMQSVVEEVVAEAEREGESGALRDGYG